MRLNIPSFQEEQTSSEFGKLDITEITIIFLFDKNDKMTNFNFL